MLNYLDAYKVFLQNILNTGDPTKTNPREIISAIGIFLKKIMDSYKSIDQIFQNFEGDHPDLALKVRPILNNFPEGARNIFKALTEICLINEKAALNPDPGASLKPGEAEQSIIDSLDNVLTLLTELSFMFKDDRLNPIDYVSELFKNLTDDLKTALLRNLGLFGNMKSEVGFRYNVTMASSEVQLAELTDLIKDTYPGIGEADLNTLLANIMQSTNLYLDAAGIIRISVLSKIDNLQVLYKQDIDKKIIDVNKMIEKASSTLTSLISKNADKNKFKDCLVNDGLETVVTNVPNTVLEVVREFYENLRFDETTLGELSYSFDGLIQQYGRIVIRSINLAGMKEDLTEVSLKLRKFQFF